jgi:DNA-binding response OmpR family regulator
MRIVILADDLIWATRLADLVRGAGAEPRPVRTLSGLETALPDSDRVIVDLTARAYDGLAAIAAASAAGRPILAVGQHDDVELRKAALAAGAQRVHPYRRLFEDGPRQMAAWLATAPAMETPA